MTAACTVDGGYRIYHHPTLRHIELPPMDLLTFLFESEHSVAQDDTVLHVEANDPENKLNKAGLSTLAQNIAHGLRHRFKIGANGPNKDTITVISHGQILVPALLFGIIAAGGVYSAASPSSTVAELARQVKIGRSNTIICGAEHVDVAIKAAKECGISLRNVLLLDSAKGIWKLESLEDHVSAISKFKLKWRQVYDRKLLKESLIVILWSSGTTGLPKGVMLSHTNLVAETFLTALSGREFVARETAAGRPPDPKEYRTLAHLPISHIAGLFGYLIGAMYSGGEVVWMRKYTWEDLLANLKRYTITSFYTVPSIWLRISKSSEIGPEHLGSLEGAATGAAPMDSQLQKASNARIKDGKSTFIGQTWGLSETTGAITAHPAGEEPDDTGCIGYILPTVELRLVDENFRDVEPGQEGEFLVRTPLVMNGYYENPQATAETFREGWFCTGDIGIQRTNGRFYVVDRKKELLKYKGLQVAPAEIENLLFTHPSVREAAVVGVPAPDDPGTDWPRAYVVRTGDVSKEEIKEYVKTRLAPYKQLRGGVLFVDEIPKNAIGKFLRRDLRERAKREMKGEGLGRSYRL